MKYIYIISFLIVPFLIPLNFGKVNKIGSPNIKLFLADPTLPTLELKDLKAFPTADGYGRFSSGGRGGPVIYVTNTNDSGSGSFRAAAYTSGTKNILFNIGGTIARTQSGYSGVYEMSNTGRGNVTIAGQTAVGVGIMIKEGEIRLGHSNSIIRYLKLRHGSGASPSNEDALNITAYSGAQTSGIIIDHVSMGWGVDENLSVLAGHSGSKMFNITIQNSIVHENKYGTLFNKDSYQVSYLNNYHAHNTERNIRANYAVANKLKFETINNIFYGGRTRTDPTLSLKFTHLNNLYKKSTGTAYSSGAMVNAVAVSAGETSYLGATANVSNTYAYIEGNVSLNGLSEQSGFTFYLETSAYNSSGYESYMTTASGLPDKILSHVGASLPSRDAVDTRLVAEYYSGEGDVDTTPSYASPASGTAVTDSDGDGMPNDFETAHDLNPISSADGGMSTKLNWTFTGLANILNTAGYTNLEMYMNWKAGDYQRMIDGLYPLNSSFSITPAVGGGTGDIPVIAKNGADTVYYTAGDIYTELNAVGTDTEDGTITGSIVITNNINMAIAGTYYVYYNLTDSDSNDAVQQVRTVVVQPPEGTPFNLNQSRRTKKKLIKIGL